MLQIELYVADLTQTARLLTTIFDMAVIAEKPGFQHLHHADHFAIMLFNPEANTEGEAHWPVPRQGEGGQGIEIVLVTNDAVGKHAAVNALGYACSAVRLTPWGSTEFTFRLPEGYLLRVKEMHAAK